MGGHLGYANGVFQTGFLWKGGLERGWGWVGEGLGWGFGEGLGKG